MNFSINHTAASVSIARNLQIDAEIHRAMRDEFDSMRILLQNHESDCRISCTAYAVQLAKALRDLPAEQSWSFMEALKCRLGRSERAAVYPQFYAWARAHGLIPEGMTDKQWF